WIKERTPFRRMSIPPLTSVGARAILDAYGIVIDDRSKDTLVRALVGMGPGEGGLTGGDPLLLQLYAEEFAVRQKRGEPSDITAIRHLKPGYASYFEEWFRTHQSAWGENRSSLDAKAKTALAVLATAHGPLLHEELSELMRLSSDSDLD